MLQYTISRISQGTNKADVDGDALDDIVNSHLQNLYGLNPDAPHMALQFPRLPPMGKAMFGTYVDPVKGQLMQNAASLSHKLYGFHHMFQQHAAGLLATGSPIIPPGHPLYGGKNSFETLQTENDKLQKENARLKKMLKKEPPAGGPSIPF